MLGSSRSESVDNKWRERTSAVLVGVVIAGVLGATAVAQTVDNPPEGSPALCTPDDPNPEPGIQGDVPNGASPAWDCGVEPIGFLPGANGPMAVADHCAYTGTGLSGGDGVRVIDVSDPTTPEIVKVLPTSSRELLAAQVTDERSLLATRRRDPQAQPGQLLGRDMLIDVWDIRECTDPQLVGTVRIPTASDLLGDIPLELGGPAHNLRFNPSATKLYGSLPPHEIDLTDLDDPDSWTVRNLHCTIVDQDHVLFASVPGLCGAATDPGLLPGMLPQISHEPTFNPAGSRLYIGAQVPVPTSNAMWVLDMTGPDPVVLSVTEDAPGHSIDFATIDGREYLVHSNEIATTNCIPEAIRPKTIGFGDRVWLLDITDETAPQRTSEIILEDSRFERCGLLGSFDFSVPTTAYHDVDDPLDTTYAVVGFGPAGFRFFDLRDPQEPVEIAYFNHGASEHTKPYVIPETGHIWASNSKGFWVLELEPQVRDHLAGEPVDDEAAASASETTSAADEATEGLDTSDAAASEVEGGAREEASGDDHSSDVTSAPDAGDSTGAVSANASSEPTALPANGVGSRSLLAGIAGLVAALTAIAALLVRRRLA